MTPNQHHISERELVLAANGELSQKRLDAVQHHVAGCDECRRALSSYEAALGQYFDAYREGWNLHTPELESAQARLTQRMERRTAIPWLARMPGALAGRAALGAASVAVCLAGIAVLRFMVTEQTGFAPDSALTPGLTRSVTAAELCAIDADEPAPTISRAAAIDVFRRHGITDPPAGAYELDYLIPPELGGARDERNLWPQPYGQAPWNAHAKDALEDRLRRLVCDGQLDLRSAQQEIANDWTIAYRKYFETDEPLLSHARFLKDVPWQ